MRVAAIDDFHGDLPALEAVLDEIGRAKVDRVVCGGDVFPGPLPCETLARLLAFDEPVEFLRGNGDREVLAQMTGTETDWLRTAPESWREPVRWTAQELPRDHERLLTEWPATYCMAIPGLGDVLFCHATPRDDTEVFTRRTPDERLLPIFDRLDVAVVVCGHTHMQFDRTVGPFRVVNAGSVGMLYGKPGAYWLLLDPDIELRHTSYDLAAAADRIRATTYPQAAHFAEYHVVRPPSEETILQVYAPLELQ